MRSDKVCNIDVNDPPHEWDKTIIPHVLKSNILRTRDKQRQRQILRMPHQSILLS